MDIIYVYLLLFAFAIIVFGFVYLRARWVAKKYCEFYELDFKRFWRDIFLLKNKWEDNKWDRRRYKINQDCLMELYYL